MHYLIFFRFARCGRFVARGRALNFNRYQTQYSVWMTVNYRKKYFSFGWPVTELRDTFSRNVTPAKRHALISGNLSWHSYSQKVIKGGYVPCITGKTHYSMLRESAIAYVGRNISHVCGPVTILVMTFNMMTMTMMMMMAITSETSTLSSFKNAYLIQGLQA